MNSKIKILLYIIIIFSCFSFIKAETFRIYVDKKIPTNFYINSNIYKEVLNQFDKKALKRRKINFHQDSLITPLDYPIPQSYFDTLNSFNLRVINYSNWFNFILIETDREIINELKNLEFIIKIEETYRKNLRTQSLNECDVFEYYDSFNQIQMLNIPEIHKYGFLGQNSIVGFLDSGFDFKFHKSFSHINVSKEYDFINNDFITSFEEGDLSFQHHHGTIVLSTVASFDNGNMIGISPLSEFMLAKTEDLKMESHLEEDYMAIAVEWLEKNGADITNASLGYKIMDSTSFNYNLDDLDGESNIVARAYNYASKMGVICVNSAGNMGNNTSSILAPADADSCVAVGALDSDGNIASLSSFGPNGKGSIKPELVAQGIRVKCVSPENSEEYITANGTSLSSPLITGLFSILKSIYPDLPSYKIKDAVFKSSSNYNSPNNSIGYGIPDLFKVINYLGPAISPLNKINFDNFERISTFILNDENILSKDVFFSEDNLNFEKSNLIRSNIDNLYFVNIGKNLIKADSFYIRLRVTTPKGDFYHPGKNSSTLFYKNIDYVNCGISKELFYQEHIYLDKDIITVRPSIINSGVNEVIILTKLYDRFKGEFLVTDLNGKIISQQKVDFSLGGISNINLNVSNLSIGKYYVIFKDNNLRFSTSFIKIQ